MITAGLQGSVDKSLWAFKRWRHVLSLSLLRTQRHIHTHGRVDSQYNELIGWNLNNAQAKQSDSWPGKCCVSWTEAVVFLVLREDYRKPLNCFSQMKSILLNKIQAGLYIVVQKYMKYHLNSPFSSCYTSCQLQKKKKKVYICWKTHLTTLRFLRSINIMYKEGFLFQCMKEEMGRMTSLNSLESSVVVLGERHSSLGCGLGGRSPAVLPREPLWHTPRGHRVRVETHQYSSVWVVKRNEFVTELV